ncbi:transposase [Azospirillum brasilense]|uniref:Transposase IS4-like domain-containing protein n=1 Tax=Azospirillum brasilense TaxID=192 RepID=A0A235HF62_AZOBR|nr:transposase [Azospirillum brasilense]OYD84332.1 hypothetical protein CHT98_11665 [Azospirillum brasilense]
MTGALDVLTDWPSRLDDLFGRISSEFARAEPRRQARKYLEGLLGDAKRKNAWQLAEQIGDARPWRTQRVLSHVQWDQDRVRDVCRAYVAADALYGSDKSLRVLLERREVPYVLAVRGNEVLNVLTADREFLRLKASALADLVPEDGWKRLSAGVGAKGQRYYDWARLRLFRLQEPPWDHWLLIRRNRKDHADKACYVTFGPMETTLADLVRVAGRRWAVEECFEIAKQECGLAD